MDFRYLGVNLRYFRVVQNLTQRELAVRVDPPLLQAYISNLERGITPFKKDHVRLLAAALGVPEDALLRRPRTRRNAQSITAPAGAPDTLLVSSEAELRVRVAALEAGAQEQREQTAAEIARGGLPDGGRP